MRRFVRVLAFLWLLTIAWILWSVIGFFSHGPAGLAAVSGGISELLLELFLVLPIVALLVSWLWGTFASLRRA